MEKLCNIGWHYYRNYFNGIDLSNKEELKSEAMEKKFRTRNNELVKQAFPIKEFIKGNTQFQVQTTYPGLLVGSGYGHEVSAKGELKLGFFFDHTWGLPVIPGSSVKGTLRSAFPQWDKKDESGIFEIKKTKTCWIESLLIGVPIEQIKFTEELRNKIHTIELAIFEGIKNDLSKKPEDKFFSIYERDIFHDAYISRTGKDGQILGTDSITPHIKEGYSYQQAMLKNPVPIPFLKVLPGVQFTFQFVLKESGGLKPEQKKNLFYQILLTLGIGAKTNVGYGQFTDGSERKTDAKSGASGKADNKTITTNIGNVKTESDVLKPDEVIATYLEPDKKMKNYIKLKIITEGNFKDFIVSVRYPSGMESNQNAILILSLDKKKAIQSAALKKPL